MYSNRKLGIREASVKIPKSPIPEKEIEPPKAPHFPVKILYVWAMIFLAMMLYTMAWFTAGLPLIYFIGAVRATITAASSDPMWIGVVDFITICFQIHPIISLIGWFIYGILNSAKRDVDTWRTF
jgi:hypothetical protein